MVSAGDLGTILRDRGVQSLLVFVTGGADVQCGTARRGCSFFPRCSLACSLDSSVRLRYPRLNTLPPRASVFGDILL